MRVETTENGETEILSVSRKLDAGRIPRTPDRLIAACDAALENATYWIACSTPSRTCRPRSRAIAVDNYSPRRLVLGRMCHRRAHLPTACGRGDQFVMRGARRRCFPAWTTRFRRMPSSKWWDRRRVVRSSLGARCPKWLSRDAQRVWLSIVAELRRMGVLTVADGHALARDYQRPLNWW